MFSNRRHSFFRSVTFRLTLTYTAVFSVSTLILLAAIYLLLHSSLQKQTDTMLMAEMQEVSTQWREEEMEQVTAAFEAETRLGPGDEVYSRIVFADGRPAVSTNPAFWRTLPVSSAAFLQTPSEGERFTLKIPSAHEYPVRICSVSPDNGVLLQVGCSMRSEIHVLERYRHIALGMLVLAFLPASLVGWIVSRRAMTGVVRVAHTAQRIEEGDLSQRVPFSGRGDEIDLLAGSFNTMIERIQVLLAEWKEISNNIAHDLRSPITRMRVLSESVAAGTHDPNTIEWAGSVIEECDRLIGIINTMLEIAETESGTRSRVLITIDMAQLVSDAYDLFLPMAEDKGLELEVTGTDTPVHVLGETARLQRVVANLIDNAIKYTENGGHVHLALRAVTDGVELAVTDTGIGMSEEDCGRIFDRFFRTDQSRSTPGNGLGLSLAQAIVQAYGGGISVESSPGEGSTFKLHLPVAGKDV